jgi:hypothetical protein
MSFYNFKWNDVELCCLVGNLTFNGTQRGVCFADNVHPGSSFIKGEGVSVYTNDSPYSKAGVFKYQGGFQTMPSGGWLFVGGPNNPYLMWEYPNLYDLTYAFIQVSKDLLSHQFANLPRKEMIGDIKT